MDSPRAITKILLPGRRTNLLHRSRLVDFLHEHIEQKLLLVSASAGYGKTSLLVDFAHDTALPVCWYSLDASDADPKTFFEYLLASLRRQFPNVGTRTLRLLADPGVLRDIEVIVGTLVTEIHEAVAGFFVLILDDYQAVEESDEINHILDTLLRLMPETMHVILSSRALPSKLTLTRLTARQEIAGLGVGDLRFTADEIRTLIRENYQIEFSEQDAAQLTEHSEGWITGILLTTHSLWKGLFKNLVRVQGTHSHVFNYLANEVLAQQPPELQRFLIDSSILDQLDPATCNRLLGMTNSAGMLRVIEQKNLFVVRLEELDAWYRYHSLFQEFLQAQLIESDVTRWLDLNHRVAGLFEDRNEWALAISHYLKARAFDEAVRVIERIAKDTFDAGHWPTLAKWIDAVPVALLNAHPDLLIYRARVFDEMGDRVRAIEIYSRTLEIYAQRSDSTGMARALIKQASCWRVQGRYEEAIQNCQRALTLLDRDDKREHADAHRILGISYGMLGDLKKDIAELELALRDFEALGDLPRIALLHHDLGSAHHTAGNAESENHYQQALDYWRRANNAAGLADTLNSIGVRYHQQGRFALAVETLEQALIAARRCGHLRVEALTLASLGDVYRDTGESARAQQLYQTAYEIARQINEGFVITYALSALGEIYRALGDLPTAQRLLQQALEQAESHRSNYEIGLTKTALGILQNSQGDREAAAESLERAIELLERGGARREAARAHLHLAATFQLERKFRQANEQLKITADLGTQLGEEQFAIADRNSLAALIGYAVSKKISASFYPRLLEKMRANPAAPAPEETAKPFGEPIHRIEARAFGTAAVSLDGKLISKTDWDSASAKELFFFLLANRQGLSKDQILNALWGNTSAARASGIFHSTAYRIRRALLPDCLVYENGLYRINPDLNIWLDVTAFNNLVASAEYAKTRENRIQHWREAVKLYMGDYFEDSYSDWTRSVRSSLQSKYLDILAMLADHYDQDAKTEEAIALYQQVLSKDSLRESIYRALMHLQTKSGDRRGALSTYQRCLDTLRDEMGIEPSRETRRLAEQIMGEQQ